MYIDKLLLLADTATGTASAASTDYIDTTVAGIKHGDVNDAPWLVVKTEAAFTAGAGAPTATFQLQTSEDANFLDSTSVTLAQSAAFVAADLTVNKIMWRIKLPVGLKRYIRVYKVVDDGGNTKRFALGTWTAFITKDVDINLP